MSALYQPFTICEVTRKACGIPNETGVETRNTGRTKCTRKGLNDQFEEGDLKDPEVPWTSNRRLYAGMTKYLDDMVGSVVEALKGRSEKGGTMYDNTLIVFTADNGGPVYEPGSANNHPLKGGKYSDWEGGVRTNAFVSGGYLPKHRRGKKFHGVISIADWYATFCEMAGVSHFDEESEEANRYLVANGMPLLPPVDYHGV